MKPGTVAIFFVLLMLLGVTVGYTYLGLSVAGDPMPTLGWVATILGVFSLIIGIGRMALVFYSSRRGYE